MLPAARPGDHLLFPVSRQEGLADRERVHARVKDYLTSEPRYRGREGLDLVVIFTDESGRAILPDSAAEAAAPEAPGPPAKNVLSFTFDSSRGSLDARTGRLSVGGAERLLWNRHEHLRAARVQHHRPNVRKGSH